MATKEFDRSTLPAFTDRLARLTAESPRQWGEMDVDRTLRHLIFSFEMSLGEQDVEDKSVPIFRDLIFVLFFRLFTNWPKAKIKGPEISFPPPEEDFGAARETLKAKMRRFADELERRPDQRQVNPTLGPIPLTRWSRLHGLHTDHHLRQFGV